MPPLRLAVDREDLDFNEVFFSDAKVPAENLIGPLNGGWSVVNSSLGHDRTLQWLMFADRLDDLVADFHPTGPLERDQYATLLMDSHALRLLGSAAVAREARGEQDVPSLSVLKLLGAEAVQSASEHAFAAAGVEGLHHPALTSGYDPFGRAIPAKAGSNGTPVVSAGRSPAKHRRSSAGSSPGGCWVCRGADTRANRGLRAARAVVPSRGPADPHRPSW